MTWSVLVTVVTMLMFSVVSGQDSTNGTEQSFNTTGADIVELLQQLEVTLHTDPRHIILWGVSMGVQTSAYASQIYRVGRIIGCDPAGPLYDLLPASQRISRDDADLVEIVHLSKAINGGTNLVHLGHINFVINNGEQQPGCDGDGYCNHIRAALLYRSSIERCRFVFRRCLAYWAFNVGLCDTNPTLTFGLHLDPETAPRDAALYFYKEARHEYPYCAPEDEGPQTFNARVC